MENVSTFSPAFPPRIFMTTPHQTHSPNKQVSTIISRYNCKSAAERAFNGNKLQVLCPNVYSAAGLRHLLTQKTTLKPKRRYLMITLTSVRSRGRNLANVLRRVCPDDVAMTSTTDQSAKCHYLKKK